VFDKDCGSNVDCVSVPLGMATNDLRNKVMLHAAEICGEEVLARSLSVPVEQLSQWMHGEGDPPPGNKLFLALVLSLKRPRLS
jgi:hypothetical protein